MINPIGLNAAALTVIAEEMRTMNEKPNMEMPHSEFMAASGTYAMIAALESLAHGLRAVEEQEMENRRKFYEEQMRKMRMMNFVIDGTIEEQEL